MPPDLDAGELPSAPLDANTLILVCCHAVYTGPPTADPTLPAHWLLQPFQRASRTKPSEHLLFLRHIARALALQQQQHPQDGQRPLIVLSGGPTNPLAPTASEAAGYLSALRGLLRHPASLAAAAVAGPDPADPRASAFTDPPPADAVRLEERATDSLQNLLFGLCAFAETRGRFPSSVVAVSHAFKSERLAMHRAAVGWTRPFRVVGIDPQWDDDEARATAELERRTREQFALDPYAARAPLAGKRLARRWDAGQLDALAANQPAVVGRLLRWRGGESGRELFPERLPWEDCQ